MKKYQRKKIKLNQPHLQKKKKKTQKTNKNQEKKNKNLKEQHFSQGNERTGERDDTGTYR